MLKELIASQDKQRLTTRLSRNVMKTKCGCIEYGGAKNNCGYRKVNFRFDGEHVQVYAHRLFWVLATGKNIPSNRVIDHKCQNRACVNPAHLQLVAPETNSRLATTRKH